MNFLDFARVATEVARVGAQSLVRCIMYEKLPHDEGCANHSLYYKFDNNIVNRNNVDEKVALKPLVKKFLKKALVDDLAELFEKNILDYVCPFSQDERDKGIPGDVAHNTPVKLRATNEDEWLTFVFSADLNLETANPWEIWQNVKVDIRYVKLDGAENRQ
jgi:hypothetical protein